VIFTTSCWIVIVLQYFLPMVLLLPVRIFGVRGRIWYRHLVGHYDRWAGYQLAVLPLTCCGLRIYLPQGQHREFLKFKSKGNALMLSTHCSRIDWLIGYVIGILDDDFVDAAPPPRHARVGYVAEATTALMPVLGQKMLCFGDIFVTRAFHKDAPNIQRNIATYHSSRVERLLFLAPEGYIADPGCAEGAAYIANCDAFMESHGQAPMTHLLTPRYKGMQHFLAHSPDNVGACAMAIVSDSPQVDAGSGTVVGGVNATLALSDARRTVPDLHAIFRGGLSVFISFHTLPFAADARATPDALREALLADQQAKDAELRYFEAHRRYPTMASGEAWDEMGVPHARCALVLALHTLASLLAICALSGASLAGGVAHIALFVGLVILAHGTSHLVGMLLTDGTSRESLVGETAVKAALGVAKAVLDSVRCATKSPKRA